MFSKIIFHQTITHHIFDSTKQVLKQQLKHSLSKNDCIQLNSADTHVLVTLPIINKRCHKIHKQDNTWHLNLPRMHVSVDRPSAQKLPLRGTIQSNRKQLHNSLDS